MYQLLLDRGSNIFSKSISQYVSPWCCTYRARKSGENPMVFQKKKKKNKSSNKYLNSSIYLQVAKEVKTSVTILSITDGQETVGHYVEQRY